MPYFIKRLSYIEKYSSYLIIFIEWLIYFMSDRYNLANIYLFKVSSRNTRSYCFYCWLWTYFAPFSSVSIVDFEQVNVSWKLTDTPVSQYETQLISWNQFFFNKSLSIWLCSNRLKKVSTKGQLWYWSVVFSIYLLTFLWTGTTFTFFPPFPVRRKLATVKESRGSSSNLRIEDLHLFIMLILIIL